ncbi:acr-24 [Pristionchus pacificus]|uniref:Acr-24 n=1 Tax=Pristionchus pacificus TaxID=54126 RepID=A0A2A6BYM3_PRIPA|nr:acr-24 [Pristionchus pacificus]|eukprot:PDM71015.1 acr-24 [Pristionchus pacificus]
MLILSLLLHILLPSYADRDALLTSHGEFLPHIRLAKDLTDSRRYDRRVRPVVNHSQPTTVMFSMSLYQILSINEKLQNVDLNVWVIQKWRDDFLGWNPVNYGYINQTILPYDHIWLPDTYLYNSVVMNREETERYINVVITTNYWEGQGGAEVQFMYPALYRTSCQLDIRFFPYDQQNCTLVISSWTSSKSDINYEAEFASVNLDNFIPNEEWIVISFEVRRIESKFVCCPEPWVLLEASLVVRRKPLYYIVNLVIPTSVITMVAVTGFFTAASTSSERREKLSLGIDSLLAMSILMMMVSEQMPTTSDYIPLFGLFYLTIILIIFMGTLFTAFILNVHLQKLYSHPVSPLISFIFFHKIARWLSLRPPTTLIELWNETGVRLQKKPRSKSKDKADRLVSNGRQEESMVVGSGSEILPIISPSSTVLLSARSEGGMEEVKNKWKRLARNASIKKSAEEKSPNAFISTECNLLDVKLKRRYALEWEFLATVLDRLLLILFSILVFAVTILMILVGEAMHLSYELADTATKYSPSSLPSLK